MKYSQAELAEISGLSKSLISKLEGGYTKPSINTFIKICSALDIPYDEAANISLQLMLENTQKETKNYSIFPTNLTNTSTEILLDSFPMAQAKEVNLTLNLDFDESQLAILALLATESIENKCNYSFDDLKKDKDRLINIVNQIFITIRNDSAFHNSLK